MRGERMRGEEEEREVGIWICKSKIKKLNNHQKSGDLYRNVRKRISQDNFFEDQEYCLI
jgi:hypothetical protein